MYNSVMSTNYTPRGTARERILDVAEKLFYGEGIRAVGIDRIIADSGIAKMTFYNHFKSKDELVTAYVQRRGQRWRDWFEQAIEHYARSKDERPLAIFDALEERFTYPDYRGCAFINTIIELANHEHMASQSASDHKQSVQQFVRQILEEAHYRNSDLLSQQFMLLMDGATVVALREGTPTAAQVARQIAVQLLAASTSNP
jgi:AcrR family transcriptional regulator